jgi:uncharacterized membrane protein/protein-disulfide isomerase
MENKKKSIIIFILVILGLLVTVDLAYIYYQANFNQYALPSFCAINDFIDCDGVARTTESQFLGVPLAYWGMFLYAFMLMLLCVDFLKKIPFLKFLEVFKNKFHYIASLGIISFTISMMLAGVSFLVIDKLCLMCVVTYVINLFIGLVAAKGLDKHFVGAIQQSWKDFVDALKPIPYRIAFVIVMIVAGCFLGWTYTSAKFSPALKFKKSFGEFVNTKVNKYAVKGNILGSKDKDAVVLHIYSDYNCPMCFACNVMLHKLAKEFTNVRIEAHSLPLDTDCNKYLERPFHIGSCTMAKYSVAAKNQNKFWEVESLFFEKKPADENSVIETLKNSGLGLDMDKLAQDVKKQETMEEILKDIDYAMNHNKMGTPLMQLGDELEMGIQPYPELKEWVIKHGGKPKHSFF